VMLEMWSISGDDLDVAGGEKRKGREREVEREVMEARRSAWVGRWMMWIEEKGLVFADAIAFDDEGGKSSGSEGSAGAV
jgi:hypothetical protein